MARLNRRQRSVLADILWAADRAGASAKERKAAVETGLVEANLTNPAGGDRDSVGWRQERGHYGSASERLNVRRSALRFFGETRAVRDKYATAGELAAAVQRPAAQFRGRYQERSGEARAILRGESPRMVGSDSSQRYLADDVSVEPAAPGPATVAPLLAQQLERPAVASSAPGEAAHSARRALALPAAYRAVESSGGPVAARDAVGEGIRVAATLGGQTALEDVSEVPAGGARSGRVPTRGARSRLGEVVVGPTANRAGAKLQGVLTHFVSEVAGLANHPVEITTGTNHDRLTVNGRVSDHWDGHAADIGVPVDSRRGDVIATAALIAAGVPRARARKMARAGGLFTVARGGRRIQVIWKTNEGGNHHDHVHVGIR